MSLETPKCGRAAGQVQSHLGVDVGGGNVAALAGDLDVTVAAVTVTSPRREEITTDAFRGRLHPCRCDRMVASALGIAFR